MEAGGSKELASKALSEVRKNYHKEITTQEILNIILKTLREDPGVAMRYDLKRAIMSLGPSGFPFETFFGNLLKYYGYKIKIGNKIKGKVIIHEVDIIAEKERKYMIECKYHNEIGTRTKLKPALYTYARFLDLKKYFDRPWLVTNTKCSLDAKNYAKGVGLKITGWNYPRNGNLKELIQAKKLYPITILKTINNEVKEKLFNSKIVIAKNLQNYSISELKEKTGLNEKEINKILEEVKEVCAD